MLDALPAGFFHCHWCNGGVRYQPDGGWPTRCPHCGLHPHPSKVDETVGGKVNPATAATTRRNRSSRSRTEPLNPTPQGKPIIGVDPGAKYTGVVVRDGDAVLHASTLVRPTDMDPVTWSRTVVHQIETILTGFPPLPMAVEGVSDPKGFKSGRNASINPGFIMRAAVVVGAVAQRWPDAVIVPPGGNGSRHITHYPPDLVGRRPKTLPGTADGASTRAHEQSAYDVAAKGAHVIWPHEPIPLLHHRAS